jgi:restriction system protein
MAPPKLWGLHMGQHVGDKPIVNNYVAIGWHEIGDIRRFKDREAIKQEMAKPEYGFEQKAVPVQAGVLFGLSMRCSRVILWLTLRSMTG